MKLPADTFLWKLGKRVGTPFLRKYFRISFSGTLPRPPVIIIANHVAFWDPFFLGSVIDYPVAWVAARGVFENPYLSPLVRATGAIPKRKARPDAETIKNIFGVLREGGAVGLFPEGNITWTGKFGYVFPGTDKLLDKVDVPVVGARIEGAWLSKPRWADKARGGPIHLQMEAFKDSQALEFIDHNEWDWQAEKQIPYSGNNRARGITRILWICTQCKEFGAFEVSGNEARCKKCGRKLVVDEYGYINGQDGIQFYREQRELLGEYLKNFESIKIPGVAAVLRDIKKQKKKEKVSGDLLLNKDSLKVGDRVFELGKITGETTFLKKILEFSCAGEFVRMKLKYSSLLICNSLEILKKEHQYGLANGR